MLPIMDTITIKTKNKTKFQQFLALIKDLDYVEVLRKETSTGKKESSLAEDDFFALAGMWKDREISAKNLRAKAWPNKR
jgi:hypothetical protein